MYWYLGIAEFLNPNIKTAGLSLVMLAKSKGGHSASFPWN
jgi:hypothetical protein